MTKQKVNRRWFVQKVFGLQWKTESRYKIGFHQGHYFVIRDRRYLPLVHKGRKNT